MSKVYNVTLLALAAILVVALAAPVFATDIYGEEGGSIKKLRAEYMAQITPSGLEMTDAKVNGSAVLQPSVGTTAPLGPCEFRSNAGPDPSCAIYWLWGFAGTGAGSRTGAATQIIAALAPESVKTIEIYVLWDPDNTLFAFPYVAGDLTVTLHPDDGSGLPDEGTTLASATRVFADWQADPDLFVDVNYREGFVDFDVSGGNVVLAPLTKVHAVLRATAGTSLLLVTDEGNEDGAGCDNGNKSAHYRDGSGADPAGWYDFGSYYGFNYNWSWNYEMCEEPKPPVCFFDQNFCESNETVTIFGMPRTNRNAFSTRYFAGQAGQAQPCTVKAIYPWFYENDPANTADIVVMIMEDDGAGLPGAVVWSDSLPYGTFVDDLSGPTTIAVPDVVVDGEYYIGYRAVNSSVGLATAITFVGSSLSGAATDCPQASYNNNGMFVLLPDQFGADSAWVTDEFFFGAQSELWVSVDLCCPALEFATCTPASDLDWESQGNGNARTNASTATLSSLCGINQAWSHEFETGRLVQQLQPVIAGDRVLVAATDSLHCLDKATGAHVWSIGFFPYITGDLRGAPTVDVNGDRVYFGGGASQSFTCVQLSDGAVVWSRNLGGVDPPQVPLPPGQTSWTPSVLANGVIYFTQETGRVYGLDAATGLDISGSPLTLPDAPAAVPYNALTSDGTKLWVGTANSLGTNGNIHQIDAATMVIDWTLDNPGMIFYPAADSLYDPEGFPGSMGYENGVLYYHSQIRNDGNGFAHFPQTGSVGAIDVALEDGSGAGILWVNDGTTTTAASPGTALAAWGFSGPAIGPGMLYLNSRGFFGGTTEQDGVSAWDKTLGARVWYQGYTQLGISGGVPVLDDVRGVTPITVFCQPGGTPYLLVGNVGGALRLMHGNDGSIVWEREFTNRVGGTAVADDYVVTVVRAGGATGGGGSVVAFNVGEDRPRLQLDVQFVFRTATPGDGLSADVIADAISNTGCVDLNIASYGAVNPALVRVSSVHPSLTSSAKRSAAKLTGYDAFLNPPTVKQIQIEKLAGIEEDEDESLVRTFANSARAAADPLFLAVTEAPGVVAPGASQSIAVTYDETGLTNNTGYTNYIEIASDDPDYYPQDPTGAELGLPSIQFELFIGCPDAEAVMSVGLGEVWVNNFGADAGGGNFNDPGDQNFGINGDHANMFDGGTALVVQDGNHWAFDGCSVGGYPRRAGEWGPTLPCGLTINALNVNSPLGAGTDAIEEVSWNQLDLASTNGFFNASSRGAGGVFCTVQRVASQDAAFGDFVLTSMTIQNEPGDFGGSGYPDISGALPDLYYGGVTDWDVSASDNLKAFADGYGQTDGGGPGWGNGNWIVGHARLDGDIVGAGAIGMGGSPTFMGGDIQNDQGHGDNAFLMLSEPASYGASIDPASINNTDIGALWSLIHVPSLADGESVTFYYAIYQVENGVNGLPWTNAAEADAAYAEVTCRAKAFAGFGKGDVNCDGCVDLADVVLLGNILDGLYDPTGTGGVYTADADGDNDWDQADYDLVYDVVAGVQPASALANAWRF